MTKSKQKGTAAETAVVRYLQDIWPGAERRALAGNADRGDIAGVPHTCIEVKDCVRLELAKWVDEMLAEKLNAGAHYGAVWFKRKGTTNPAQWYVLMDGNNFRELLIDALGA